MKPPKSYDNYQDESFFPRSISYEPERELILDESKILIEFRSDKDQAPNQLEKERKKILLDLELREISSLSPEEYPRKYRYPYIKIQSQRDKKWVKDAQGRESRVISSDFIQSVYESSSEIISVSPSYKIPLNDGTSTFLSTDLRRVYIKLSRKKYSKDDFYRFKDQLANLIEVDVEISLWHNGIGVLHGRILNPLEFNPFIDEDLNKIKEVLGDEFKEFRPNYIFFEEILHSSPSGPAASSVFPNDPLRQFQWNMPHIEAEYAWNKFATSSGELVIALLDTGCDKLHNDLSPNLLTGINVEDPSDDGDVYNNIAHGTWCAGVLAAVYNNEIGISGLAGNCKILPVVIPNVFNAVSVGSGIMYSVNNGARVVSMSFGLRHDWMEEDAVSYLSNIINYAVDEMGCVICASVGNDNSDSISFPASHPKVIAVGASNRLKRRFHSSNYGPGLSVMAPGEDILTTTIHDKIDPPTNPHLGYFSYDSSSAACPHVSALAAQILNVNPQLTPIQVKEIIEDTATYSFLWEVIYETEENLIYNLGKGIINVKRALKKAEDTIANNPSSEL